MAIIMAMENMGNIEDMAMGNTADMGLHHMVNMATIAIAIMEIKMTIQ